MVDKQQNITGQEPGLGGATPTHSSVSRNLPGLGGNVGVMHLAEHLTDPNPRVRERALFELARLGDDRALNGLLAMMQSRQDDRSRDRAVRSLGLLGDPRAAHPLIEYAIGIWAQSSKQAAALALRRICEAHPDILDTVLASLLARLTHDHNSGGAALMLGEIGDARAVEPLIAALTSPSSYVKYYVIPALGMLAKKHADIAPHILGTLQKYCRRVGADRKYIDAILMIGLQYEHLADIVAHDLTQILLRRGLSGNYYWPEGDAARALGEIGARHASITRFAVDTLSAALKCTHPILLRDVALALGAIDDDRAAEALRQAFKTCRNDLRPSLAKALGQKGMIEPLLGALSSSPNLHSAAAEGLGASGDVRAVEPLIDLLASDDFKTRREAAKALGLLRSSQAVHPLINVLTDGRKDVRRAAAEALGKIEKAHPGAGEPAVSALIPLLNDDTRSVQEATAKALECIQTAEAHDAVWRWRFPDAQRGD